MNNKNYSTIAALDALNVVMLFATKNESYQDKMQDQFDVAIDTIRAEQKQ